MFSLTLALLLQAAVPDAEADKLMNGIHGLVADPFKHAEELDRRFTAARKLLDENPAFGRREALASWFVKLGAKCGRPAEALAVAKERLKSKPSDPRALGGLYFEALHAATLAMKSEEVVAILRAWAKDEPQATFLHHREQMEKDAALLGRSAPTVSAGPIEGTKFSWSGGTREKIVILYFTASW